MSLIKTINLVKTFGNRKVLSGVNFSAGTGEIVSLIGMNGAGKTTFLRILSTLSRADAGNILFNDASIKGDLAGFRRKIGAVLHAPMLYGNLTGEENLRFFCRLFDVPESGKQIIRLLDEVNLTQRSRDLVRTYSRGMQQRLSIARALLHSPEFLLMDEPYTGLDQGSAERLDGLIKDYAATGGIVLLATHDLDRAYQVSTRVDILHQGRIAFSGQVEQTTSNQLSERYREITSTSNNNSVKASRG
jgi:heme exporter protein A